jgi:hypothetical protein
MSFEAKRLRVQLPCDPGGTLIEEAAQRAAPCPLPSFCICTNVTGCRQFCTQLSPCLCSHLTPCHYGTCHYGTWGCQHFYTCIVVNSGICRFDSPCGPLASLCEIPSACGPSRICPGGSEQPVDPGTIVIDPEQLPALREALEAQLKEIEKAEQALKEREGGKK